MAELIRLENFPENENYLLKPIIYIRCPDDLSSQAIALNKKLSEKLLQYKPEKRSMHLEQCLLQILAMLGNNPILKDFDVLFNPEYELDVLNMFISAYRKKSFSLIWSGSFTNGILEYSEDGFIDYKKFDISNYDVTCIF